ncbi:hypothetical protein FHL15_002428 [Xylaria flabelliformis]|uniref:Prolyl 4-hydroxylase alpha subunit Fe(2+) 2OG dioxygenase domain-containing protein n=1 Tax=Xylaria flabelliformis TaxID=2512241 RepID=A0A553I9A6_9PEZI|nr:hypothetical protein FHL15_002428 [Xylaria flabelliformis]
MSSMGQNPGASNSALFSKDCLRDALDGVVARRFFAGWNRIEPQDPEIVVDGVGEIHLPLSEEQARQIISKAHRVPFDKGSSEKIVDTAVQQNAWDLGHESFTIIAQSQWDKMLKDFLTVISRTLGVSSHIVRAELHKLSIWEKGAVFKTHVDSEKIPHMFGTLVISLPSHHRGGDVIIRYLDEEATFSTYEHAMAGVYWYSDASYEVLPLEYGYRWVLTYNLIANVSLEKPLEGIEIGNEFLRNIIESWAKADSSDSTKPLYYTLDNKNTTANLSLSTLESRDQAIIEQLLLVSHDLDFHFFLATLQLEDIREMDDEPGNQYPSLYYEDDPDTIGFCIDSTLKVKNVNDLNGNEVLSSVIIEKDNVMHDNPFGEHPHDQMDDEEVTTYYYRSPVCYCSFPFLTNSPRIADIYKALIIVPPKALGPLFASRSSDFLSSRSDLKPIMILSYCIDHCQSSDSESALEVLLQMLEKTRETGQLDWTYHTGLAEKLYKLALFHRRLELVDWITRSMLPLPLTVLGWLRRQFETFTISFERLNIGFSSVVQTRTSLNDQYQVVLAFRADAEPKDELLELIKDTPTKTIRDGNWGSSRSYEDGLALYNLTLCAHDGLEVMDIVPKLVETCRQNTEFMLGFVHEWHQGMQRKELTLTDSQTIYENLARIIVQNMSIPLLAIGDQRPCLEEQRETFLKKITVEAMSIKANNFENLWIPLLQNLLSDSEELKISLFDQSWQQFYQTVLESFLWICVGKALPASCPCNGCRELNQFSLDPTQRDRSFNRPNPSQRTPLFQVLPDHRNDCTKSGNFDNIITNVDPKLERDQFAREKRKVKAAKHLLAFDTEKLIIVLAGRYDAIMTMSFLEYPEDNAATNSSALSSMQRREPLAPLSANPTAAISPLEGGKTFQVMPSSVPPQGENISSPYNSPYNSSVAQMTPIQPINGVATMQTHQLTSPQTTGLGVRVDLSAMPSTAPQREAMRNRVGSAPYPSPWQEFVNSFVAFPGTAATRFVSNPSRPTPSTMIQHPVAGAKRKIVELIDLTSEDD